MGFDVNEMVKSKEALRRKLADRPIAEKLRLAEELSERALAIRPDDSPSPPDAPWPIPPRWQWKKMGDVATVIGGSTPPTDHNEYFGGDIPWITPADLSKYTEKTISRGARNITQAGLAHSGARVLPAGTVLFSSRAPVGYVAIASNPVSTNQGFKSFILNDEVRPDFVYYYLQRARDLARSLASGTTFLEISGKKAAQIPIPVPPLDEQQQIVAGIEKQFTRLDAGVASLKGMQIALKRYRASVLNAACEGRLVPTEAELARKENRSYETGEQLLQRILKERREKWNSKAKYKEPATPSTSELPRVPQGWTWANVGQLLHLDSGEAFKKRDYSTDGLKLFQIANVGFGKTLWKQRNFLPDSFREKYPELILRGGDIVIALNRPIIDQKLKIAQLTEQDLPAILYQRVGRLAAVSSEIGRYFFYVAQSEFILKHVRARLQGTDQPYLNTSLVPTIPVPLPPFAEQARIVAEVERRLSVIETLQATAATSFQRVTHLRQSILERAFSGSL